MNKRKWQTLEFYISNDYMCSVCHTIFGLAQPESEYTPFVSIDPEHEDEHAEDTYCSDTGLEALAHNAGLCAYHSNNRQFRWETQILQWSIKMPECPLCDGKIIEIDECSYPVQRELRV